MPPSNKSMAEGLAAALIHAVDAKAAPSKRTRSNGSSARRTPTVDALRCYFCGGEIVKLDGCIVLADQEIGPPYKGRTHVRFNHHGGREERGSLTYPGNGEAAAATGAWAGYRRVAVFGHYECGPDDGCYYVPFDDLENNWEHHLSSKHWHFFGINEAIADARKATGIRRRPPRPHEVP